MVDVVLATEGETATNFELMVAFDRDYPLPTAQTWLAPLPVLSVDRGPPPTGASGWLANFDLPSLMMTSLRPVAASDGKSRAIELRLAETAGFAASTALRFARDPHRAATVDLIGERIQPVEILDGVVPLDCSANEIFSVRAEWE